MSRRRSRTRAQTLTAAASAGAVSHAGAADTAVATAAATTTADATAPADVISPADSSVPGPERSTAAAYSVTLPVMGMTCRTCEVRIARFVGKLPDVQRVSASSVRGQVTVESSAPVPAAAIETAISKAGYEVGRTPWIEADPKIWITAGAGLLLVAALAVVAQTTGLGNLAPGAGDLSSGGLVVALLLGLVAGVSTCMALVGGLVLGLSAAFAARQPADLRAAALIRPALVFVGGRIVGYIVFGAALGAVGASLAMPPQMTAALMIAVAVVMLLVGTRLTGLSPRLAGWSPTLPMGLGARLGLADGAVNAYSDRRAATLGALSFFLPCGFTQAVQIFALSTGSPLLGAALLGTFAIGTAPGLLALAGLPLVVPGRAKPTLLRLVGVVVIGFALVNATAGIRLAGSTVLPLVGSAAAAPVVSAGTASPTDATTAIAASPPPGATAPAPAAAPAVQELATYQDADGYGPADATIRAGVPTRWTIESRSSASCAVFMVVPSLGIQRYLVEGDENVIELPALEAGTLEYTCSMGMYWGSIAIVDRPAGVTGSGG